MKGIKRANLATTVMASRAGIVTLIALNLLAPAAQAHLTPNGPYLGQSDQGTFINAHKKNARMESSDPIRSNLFLLRASAKDRIDAEVQLPSLSYKISHLEDPSLVAADLDLNKYSAKDRAIIEQSISISRLHALAQLLTRRGALLAVLGDMDKAIEDLGEAVESDQTYAPAFNNRACLKAASGDYDGAMKDATMALSLAPNFAEAYDTRGAVYLAKKQYAQAHQDLNRAIAASPSMGEAFYHRALLMNALGNTETAQADLKKAKELGY